MKFILPLQAKGILFLTFAIGHTILLVKDSFLKTYHFFHSSMEVKLSITSAYLISRLYFIISF